MTLNDARKILGLGNSFTEEELRKAYREESKKYHPDLNKEKNAEEKMKKINNAYEYLKKGLKNGFENEWNVNKKAEGSNSCPADEYDDFDDIWTEFHGTLMYKIEICELLNKEKNNIIFKGRKFKSEGFLNYSRFCDYEVKFYNECIKKINKCCDKILISILLKNFYQEQKERQKTLVSKILTEFYYAHNFDEEEKQWIKNRCKKYMKEWNLICLQSEKSIDDIVKFVSEAKFQIVKEFIKLKFDKYIKQLSNSHIYRNLSQYSQKVECILLNQFSINEILENRDIMYSTFDIFREKELRKYKKFTKQKEEKINKLIKISKKNGFSIAKLKIEELKNEMYESKFNIKYTIVEKEVETLLNYREVALLKTMIDKCRLYLTTAYKSSKVPLIHEENFKKSLYYLSLIFLKKRCIIEL